jgi:hypothetical protein
MSLIQMLNEKIEETEIFLVEIQWPIEYMDDGLFRINMNENYVEISERGAAYMNTRIRNQSHGGNAKISANACAVFSYKSFTKLVRDAKELNGAAGFTNVTNSYWRSLAEHLNSAYNMLENAGINDKYYAVVVNDVVRGILTKNYNVFPHEKIAEQLIVNNLDGAIRTFRMGDEALSVHLKVDDVQDVVMVDLVITNGHSGYQPLSYNVIIYSNNWMFAIPEGYFECQNADGSINAVKISNRHFSNVEDAFNSIESILEVAANLNLVERLKSLDASKVLRVVEAFAQKTFSGKAPERVDTILNSCNQQIVFGMIGNGHELVKHVLSYNTANGYKSSVDKLLSPMFEFLFEKNFSI